jgi:hypothetical protein
VEPLGGLAEVQFLIDREKGFDLRHLHHPLIVFVSQA